jgi:coatomer protein complex subunit alpha (xenin)
MLKIAEMRGDVMGRFHNALYLGDVEERVKILRELHQPALALLCAQTYGLTHMVEELTLAVPEDQRDNCTPTSGAKLIFPPTPITHEVSACAWW